MLSGNGLYHHTLCPILSFLIYLFLERHYPAAWPLPAALTLVYGIVLLTLNGLRRTDGPYFFFRVHHQKTAATVLWMAGLLSGTALLSWAIGIIPALAG